MMFCTPRRSRLRARAQRETGDHHPGTVAPGTRVAATAPRGDSENDIGVERTGG